MGNIFRWDSPLMKFMMLITNLVCLNVLWLVCCLPVVTAGAATTAMHYVVFQYITKQDDAVLKPFFSCLQGELPGGHPDLDPESADRRGAGGGDLLFDPKR